MAGGGANGGIGAAVGKGGGIPGAGIEPAETVGVGAVALIAPGTGAGGDDEGAVRPAPPPHAAVSQIAAIGTERRRILRQNLPLDVKNATFSLVSRRRTLRMRTQFQSTS